MELFDKLLFWVRVAVGLLVCLIAIVVFDRVGTFIWEWRSQTSHGGFGDSGEVRQAMLKAGIEILQALAAIGSAVLLMLGTLAKDWVQRKWLKTKTESIPTIQVPPERQNEKRERILEELRKRLRGR